MIKTKRSFFNMIFEEAEFENKFLEYYAQKMVQNFRISIFLGFLTAMFFIFVDLWSLPINSHFAIIVRLLFMGPMLFTLCLLSFHKSFYKYVDLAIIAAGFISALSISVIICRANPIETAYDHYYSGLCLVNVWVATYIKSRFKPALITVIINNLMYLIVALYFQNYTTSNDPHRLYVLFSNLSFIITTNIICLLSCRDVEVYARNEFLQNELQLQDQVKLIEASRMAAVGEMAAGIAHEINNPLTIILTSAQSIEKKLTENRFELNTLPPTLDKITNASNRILKIIKSLKTFSRDGTYDEFQVESLKNIINDTIYFCQEKFMHSGVELKVDEIPDVKINCKTTQISQVLVNLLNNAFDASINFKDPKVEISFKVQNNKVFLSVIDSGPGISKELREKVMLPFYTTKPVGKGTGLGLSLSKEIIEQHKGLLYIDDSNPKMTFTFTLSITK